MNITEIISNVWSVLTQRQRTAAFVLLGMMLVSMVFEMLGVGLMIPALAAMTLDDAAPSPMAGKILAWLGNPTKERLIVGAFVVLFLIYLLKTCFLLFSVYWQSRFISTLQTSLSRRLFTTYLHQPWSFHLGRNSSELLRTMAEANNFSQLCSTLLMSISDGMILIGIVALLAFFEPLGTFVAAASLGIAMQLLGGITGKRMQRWGEMRFRLSALVGRHIHQGLNGAKDVKIRGREKYFIDQYDRHARVVADLSVRQIVMGQLPRMWLELVAVTTLCVLAGTMLWQGRDSRDMVSSLGLFATAAFRLLPSVNRLALAIQNFHFGATGLAALQKDLQLSSALPPASKKIAFERSIALERVVFRFPAAPSPALDGLSIEIPHGTSVGIIGGSGAGKSTAVDVLLGLLEPAEGRVTVDGVDIRDNLRGWQNMVGYVPQSIYLCDESLRENVAFGVPPEEIDEQALERAIRAARLDDFVATLPEGLSTVVGERGVRLSGGQRQRIGIARALYHDPAVLVLDEATSALDTGTESEVMVAVNALQGAKTLVIIAHRLSTVEQCDVVYRLERGRVVRSGTLAEVVRT
jgi:ABC-type bacteriocin/lantibiotic exporter with double-glycine peptidase domain